MVISMRNNKKIFNYIAFGLCAFFMFAPIAFAAPDSNGCLLGEDVILDIKGLLNILTYAGPALMIVFTAYELFQAVGKGSLDSDAKRIWNKLLKRFMYTILLFFIPTLINVLGTALGVLDDTTCNKKIQDAQLNMDQQGTTGGANGYIDIQIQNYFNK